MTSAFTVEHPTDTPQTADKRIPPRDHVVKVYPRRIDLENRDKLKTFEETTVVADMAELEAAIQKRVEWLKTSSS